jgi:hypothetical protein
MASCGLTAVAAKYFGTFFLSVVNWSLPQPSGALRRMIPPIVSRIDRQVTTALRTLGIQGESRLFSPYVMAIGTKPDAQP